MEDKNLNPGSTPEDMPALDLDSFVAESQDTENLEPLFQELPAASAEESTVDQVSLATAPAEEPVVADTIDDAPLVVDAEQPLEEVHPADDAPQEMSDAISDAVDAHPSPETPAEGSDMLPAEAPELPPRNFSEFDIPVDTPTSEEPVDLSPATPAQATDNTVVFDLNLPESTANSDVMEQPIEPAAETAEEFTADQDSAPPAPAPLPKEPTKEAPALRKGRPKAKKGDGFWGIPHLLATLLWLAIIVAIGVSLGKMLWLCASDVLAFGRESKEVVITIDTDDGIDEIAQKLHEKGLIKYPGLFKIYADIAVDDGEIAPGTYTLDTILDYHALVSSMSSSSSHRAVVEDVLIPEGYNCRQIFELLEQNGICTVAELEEYAANGEFQEFWFLDGVERGDKYCLEGFLFPDTYDFYANSTPREALGKMLLGFNSRIDQEEVTAQLVTLNERLSAKMKANGCSEEFIAENQIDLYDLLTVASLIEEETAGASESPNIASVIYNRLTQNEVYERYLGIDAAIIYATGDAENIDTGIDSPYNTYINAGLTPTPISNPGLSSINAALDFADTDYYYYVLNPETQLHQFSKTYEEHQEWIEKFRGD